MADFEIEEGSRCQICEKGTFFYKIENCECHINPPCSSCENQRLTCDNCGYEEEDILNG